MEIIHNEINNLINAMQLIVAKGQPFAKRNKERRIRAVLRDMWKTQETPPTVHDILFYVKMWIKSKWTHLKAMIANPQ